MEKIILYLVWTLTIILLVVFINRKNFIKAQVSFLFMQVLTWLFGALVVQGGLIEYPGGFLKAAYSASFTFEFFVFPAVSAIYNVHFPEGKSRKVKAIYIISIPAVITLLEIYIEKYTQLITYIQWTWYYSFITITLTLLTSYAYYLWFFKRIKKSYNE